VSVAFHSVKEHLPVFVLSLLKPTVQVKRAFAERKATVTRRASLTLDFLIHHGETESTETGLTGLHNYSTPTRDSIATTLNFSPRVTSRSLR